MTRAWQAVPFVVLAPLVAWLFADPTRLFGLLAWWVGELDTRVVAVVVLAAGAWLLVAARRPRRW